MTLKPHENIPILYENTQKLVKEYEQHFARCRKYNEAKIHRKYEIIIADLTKENADMKSKLSL